MSSFFEYVGQCMPQLPLGLKLTLQMTVFSLILAVVVGMVMCLFSISKVKPLNWISGIYLSLIRGTPLMVQAFFIYFGITGALHIRITSFSAAILVLCLNAGAYLSEIFRSGIAAVNKGQMEACLACGMTRWQGFCRIVLPQAMRVAVPGLSNNFVDIIKQSSLAFTLGVTEIMAVAKMEGATNLKSLESFEAVMIVYRLIGPFFN